jgi:hypothetical protein
MKTFALRIALLAVLATGLVLWVAPPADAAYQNCRQVCDYVPPTDNCSCMPEYYHTTCGNYLLWGCGLQPRSPEAPQTYAASPDVGIQGVEPEATEVQTHPETSVATD